MHGVSYCKQNELHLLTKIYEHSMDDIQTNFDRIMAKFNDSVAHSAPKRLFDNFNDSIGGSSQCRKRRHSPEPNDTADFNGSSLNTSNTSISTTAPPSPWETRRLKADLLESKARISKLVQEIDREQKLRAELQTISDAKIAELTKQAEFSCNKILDLEKHMEVVRKRERGAKRELLRLQDELNKQKLSYEEKIYQMEKVRRESEDTARQVQNRMSSELSEFRRHTEKLSTELELAMEQLTHMKSLESEYKMRAAAADELKMKLEKEQQDLDFANSRIKELEYEISTYNDWKEITEVNHTRLQNMAEMSKELERLKERNKSLNELIGNKLLLEEQVYDLKTKLDKEDGGRAEAAALQVKLSHMELELKEWVKVAQDHCLPNMLVSPLALRSRIEQLLQNDIIQASEKNESKSEAKAMESQLHDYKQKCEIFAKNIEELNFALKRHKAFKERIQKKLLLVSKERDCYKQLLENFEKDLTISNHNATEVSNCEAQLRTRIEMLERTLVGYKEVCANLEKELNGVKQSNESSYLGNADKALESNGYDYHKKELDTLRLENERLRRRKEELELELEHRCIKGDYNMDRFKVIHFKNNPAAKAYERSENLIEKLQAEIERLKRRNQQLEQDHEITQARLNETNLTMNMKEINQLRAEVESTNAKMKKLKDCYKSASMEFRDVCYMLFGYKIDRVGLNTNYKIISMYAENPDDYLNFRLNESNVLDMLETPYSATLKPLIESQLVGNKSLPAFLSALTLELFQRATITIS